MLMKWSCSIKIQVSFLTVVNRALCLLSLMLLTITGGAYAGGDHSHDQKEIQVLNATARTTLPGMPSSAAYMTIRNNGKKQVQVLSVSSPVAKKTEIHTTVMNDGMMKMQRVDNLSIQPGEGLELKPGSYHVMLMGLEKTIEPTTQVPITMTFSNGNTITVVAQAMNGNDKHDHGSHMGH